MRPIWVPSDARDVEEALQTMYVRLTHQYSVCDDDTRDAVGMLDAHRELEWYFYRVLHIGRAGPSPLALAPETVAKIAEVLSPPGTKPRSAARSGSASGTPGSTTTAGRPTRTWTLAQPLWVRACRMAAMRMAKHTTDAAKAWKWFLRTYLLPFGFCVTPACASVRSAQLLQQGERSRKGKQEEEEGGMWGTKVRDKMDGFRRSVKKINEHYASLDEPDGPVSWQEVLRMDSVVSLGEFMIFALDFQICPKLVCKAQIAQCFYDTNMYNRLVAENAQNDHAENDETKTEEGQDDDKEHDDPKEEGGDEEEQEQEQEQEEEEEEEEEIEDNDEHDNDETLLELDPDAFVQCLVRVAEHAFSQPLFLHPLSNRPPVTITVVDHEHHLQEQQEDQQEEHAGKFVDKEFRCERMSQGNATILDCVDCMIQWMNETYVQKPGLSGAIGTSMYQERLDPRRGSSMVPTLMALEPSRGPCSGKLAIRVMGKDFDTGSSADFTIRLRGLPKSTQKGKRTQSQGAVAVEVPRQQVDDDDDDEFQVVLYAPAQTVASSTEATIVLPAHPPDRVLVVLVEPAVRTAAPILASAISEIRLELSYEADVLADASNDNRTYGNAVPFAYRDEPPPLQIVGQHLAHMKRLFHRYCSKQDMYNVHYMELPAWEGVLDYLRIMLVEPQPPLKRSEPAETDRGGEREHVSGQLSGQVQVQEDGGGKVDEREEENEDDTDPRVAAANAKSRKRVFEEFAKLQKVGSTLKVRVALCLTFTQFAMAMTKILIETYTCSPKEAVDFVFGNEYQARLEASQLFKRQRTTPSEGPTSGRRRVGSLLDTADVLPVRHIDIFCGPVLCAALEERPGKIQLECVASLEKGTLVDKQRNAGTWSGWGSGVLYGTVCQSFLLMAVSSSESMNVLISKLLASGFDFNVHALPDTRKPVGRCWRLLDSTKCVVGAVWDYPGQICFQDWLPNPGVAESSFMSLTIYDAVSHPRSKRFLLWFAFQKTSIAKLRRLSASIGIQWQTTVFEPAF
eukprot:ANDGO_05751.mRNA.1 hypothetical protein